MAGGVGMGVSSHNDTSVSNMFYIILLFQAMVFLLFHLYTCVSVRHRYSISWADDLDSGRAITLELNIC